MKNQPTDVFLKVLADELNTPAEVILTGASAGSFWGHIRPSLDLDFEIRLKKKTKKTQAQLEQAIAKATKISGLSAQYSENIGGWSMISYLDYRKRAVPYRQIKKLKVNIMAPEYWTIGKMARFFELDIQDTIRVIKKKRIKPEVLILLWAKAVTSSPLSIELGQFRNHVIDFIQTYGKKIWGTSTDTIRLVERFKHEIG